MTRSTHLPSPDATEVRAIVQALSNIGWPQRDVAGLIGISSAALEKALSGMNNLRGSHWLLLRVMASQSARDALPPAPLL